LSAVAGWLREHPGPPVLVALAAYLIACEWLFVPGLLLSFRVGVGAFSFVAEYVLFGLIAALMMLPIVFAPDAREGLYRRVLAHRSLAWLGLVSYGIFLWQFPVLIALLDIDATSALSFLPEFPVLLAMTFTGTVICAALSFYLLERPIMRRARSGGWPIAMRARLRSESVVPGESPARDLPPA
jgi:peptidoglycan/LPS O-acetylase OafA/YrhL